MTRKLSNSVPVGVSAKPVFIISVVGLVFCLITSVVSFWMKFMNYYNDICYYDDAGVRHFNDHPKMAPFSSFNANFDAFEIYFVCMALLAAYFFVHHFVGSKSIYTMRRLKNPLELYVRCLAVPVVFIILGIALIYLLNFIYIEIYLFLVPEDSLFPWWNKDIWRGLL